MTTETTPKYPFVSKISVTGGYLDGLSVDLTSGLNVVIGGRGAGKTSLIEFLKWVLGVPTDRREKEQKRFLERVLGDGEVSVEIVTEQGESTYQASAQRQPKFASKWNVLSISQGALDDLVSSSRNRLELIDRVAGIDNTSPGDLVDQIIQQTNNIYNLKSRLEECKLDKLDVADLSSRLQEIDAQISAHEKNYSNSVISDKNKLQGLDKTIQRLVQKAQSLSSTEAEFETIKNSTMMLMQKVRFVSEEVSGVSAGLDAQMTNLLNGFGQMVQDINLICTSTVEEADRLTEEAETTRGKALPIRRRLDEAQQGLSDLTLKRRNLDSDLQAQKSLADKIAHLTNSLNYQRSLRAEVVDDLGKTYQAITSNRIQASRDINQKFDGDLEVGVTEGGDISRYETFLSEKLYGSSIRTTSIKSVANSILPSLLADLVEDGNADQIRALSDVSPSTAAKIVEYLDNPDSVSELLTMQLGDEVSIRSLVAGSRKSVEEMSAGQKAATVLPILLSEQSQILVLDQPEDNLDNSYIVSRIVRGLTERTSGGAQSIVVTHNPNIPVIGESSNVIVLSGGGRSGKVETQGAWNEEKIIHEITSLMEGGREAFQRRAAAYEGEFAE